MPNNNVAILSLMAKFDEKSIEQAAAKLGKTTEQALSDVGKNEFGAAIVKQFNDAMKTVKGRLKGVKLSSYTNNLLDSLFSDKDIADKTKDLEDFANKISALSKSLTGLDKNSLNSMNTRQLDAVIAKQEKILAKEQEIATKRAELEKTANNIASDTSKKNTISSISKNYLSSDYKKSNESLKKLLTTENEFEKSQEEAILNLSKMLALYSDMEKVKPEKGTSEAIQYSLELLTVVKEIQKISSKVDLFTNGRASQFVSDNFSSISKVIPHNTELAKQDFITNGLKNLNSQKTSLEKLLTDYISTTVQKNFEKTSKQTEAVIDKIDKRTDKLQSKLEGLNGSSAKKNSSLINNIVDESELKTLEEVEDRLYQIWDKEENTDKNVSAKELKEFIRLYKQYEQLASQEPDYEIDQDYKGMYESIIESSDAMKKYADSIQLVSGEQEKVEQQIESVTDATEKLSDEQTKVNNNKASSGGTQYENLESDLAEIKTAIGEVTEKLDFMNNVESVKNLESQLSELDEKVLSVNDSVNKLIESISLLSSSSSSSDFRSAILPLYNGINDIFEQKNGKQISGYWDEVKRAIENSNDELREQLQLIGLLNKDGKVDIINSGLNNSGGIIGDKTTIIARKNKALSGKTQYETTSSLKSKLDEAYEAGVNVSRILDIIGNKESNVILEVQETQTGNMLGNDDYSDPSKSFVNTEYLEATDGQILKLIKDIQLLEKIGLSVDLNSNNLFYDREKGFSFIDLNLQDNLHKTYESYEDMIEELGYSMQGTAREIFTSLNDTSNESLLSSFEERFEKLAQQWNASANTTEIKENLDAESEGMKEVEVATEEAADAKKEFATANENALSSIDDSENPLKLEAELMEKIAKSAREAADAKKEFVEANKQVANSASESNSDLQSEHSENAEPAGVKKYKKKGYKARDNKSHDNEIKVEGGKNLEEALRESQNKIVSGLNNNVEVIKEITDFYDSNDNLVKTQMKVIDAENKRQTTYTTSYSLDKSGNVTAWTSHIDTQKVVDQAKQEAEVVKTEWNENLKVIQEYAEAVTKLNNLKARNTGSGNYSNQIEDQEAKVAKLKDAAFNAQKAISSMVDTHHMDNKTWTSWLAMMEQFDQATNGSTESVAKLKDALEKVQTSTLDSIQSTIDSYQKKVSNFKATPEGFD